jgi:hypothetical protein
MLTGVLGFAALTIDVGQVVVARRQLQNAVDAGAHAGVQVLPDEPTYARNSARSWAAKNGATAGEITGVTVSRTNAANDTITVTAQRTVQFTFARVLPDSLVSSTVTTRASAMIGSVVGGKGIMPFGIKDLNGADPGFGYTMDDEIALRRPPGHHFNSGNYGILALDGRGGDDLRTTLEQGGSNTVYKVGDRVYTEPGQKQGPLTDGLEDWASNHGDTLGSSCDNWDASHSYVEGKLVVTRKCAYRVVLVPIINDWPNGRHEVTIVGFAQVYVAGFGDEEDDHGGGGKQKTLRAVFLTDTFSHPDIIFGAVNSYGTRVFKISN